MKVLALAILLSAAAAAQQLTASTAALQPVTAATTTSSTSAAPTEIAIVEPLRPTRPEPAAKLLPETPRKVADRKFWSLTAFQATAAIFDVESTIEMQHRGCIEGWSSWAVGQEPGRGKLYMSAALSNLATATVAYWLKKKGKQYWWYPQATLGSLHTFAASRNRFLLDCHW